MKPNNILLAKKKLPCSIPKILLHLVLLAGAFWFFTSILRFVIGDKNDKQILINIIFFLEVTLAFYFIPLKHPLKTSKFGFTLTVLGSILNIYIMIFSAYLTINLVKPRPHYPYFEFVCNLMPLLLCLPLLTYISGFIDKKHFYTLAAIIFTSSILAFALFLSLDFDSETYEYAALQSLNPHPCI